MTLSAFLALGDARIWTYWKYFFDTHVNFLGPVSCFSPSRDPLRVHLQGWLLWLYGHNILSLLKWQATFFVFPSYLPSLSPFFPSSFSYLHPKITVSGKQKVSKQNLSILSVIYDFGYFKILSSTKSYVTPQCD